MGRVHPPKVVSGEAVTSGTINEGVSAFRSQSTKIDSLNVRDEALGQRELGDNTFVRDFSHFASSGPSEVIERLGVDLEFPIWHNTATWSSKNGNGAWGGRPHVTITNDPSKNDVSIIRVSCGIWMEDYGFQTYRESIRERFKGAIIRCLLSSFEGGPVGEGDLKLSSVQWFQMPWSGAKWNSVPQGSGPHPIYAREEEISDIYFHDWYKPDLETIQFLPYENWDDQGKDQENKSPMTFDYNFHYQATFVWKPSGSGPLTRTFGLLTSATFDTPGRPPDFRAFNESDTHATFGESTTILEDDEGEEVVTGHAGTVSFSFWRHGVEYPGFYIRNCTMNAVTYSGGR